MARVLRLVAALLLVVVLPVRAAEDPLAYTQVTPARFGTGKIFMGREIARAIDATGADWLERPEREAEEGTDRIPPMLKLKPDHVVADIGAGTGYFSVRLAKAVPKGRVYAEDIDPGFIDIIRRRQAAGEGANIVPVLGTVSDPNLPPVSLDLVLMVDVWHELLFPREMGAALMKALKPGGRIALVEYRGEDAESPILALHRMTVAQARRELEALGFRWVSTDSRTLPIQHLMIFEKPG